MTTLIERLRAPSSGNRLLCAEAADEIEKLYAALEHIANAGTGDSERAQHWMLLQRIAREALAKPT
jgi:hypothetical protein